jgi:hypothetical protein
MGSNQGFSGGEKLAAKLKEIVDRLNKPNTLKVGFFEGAKYPDGTSVAMVAAIQNYGHQQSVSRPGPSSATWSGQRRMDGQTLWLQFSLPTITTSINRCACWGRESALSCSSRSRTQTHLLWQREPSWRARRDQSEERSSRPRSPSRLSIRDT